MLEKGELVIIVLNFPFHKISPASRRSRTDDRTNPFPKVTGLITLCEAPDAVICPVIIIQMGRIIDPVHRCTCIAWYIIYYSFNYIIRLKCVRYTSLHYA